MTDFERLVKQLGGNPNLKPGEIGISDVQSQNTKTAAANKAAVAAAAATSSSGSGTGTSGFSAVDSYVNSGGDSDDYLTLNYKSLGYSTAAQAKAAYAVYQQTNTAASNQAEGQTNMYNNLMALIDTPSRITQKLDDGTSLILGLDADVSDSMSKYEQRSGRTFKMTGSPLERLLSTWAKYEGYALNTTDEFQKGGIKAETERGLNELAAQGLVRGDYADTRSTEIAKQRAFQNDGTLSRLSTGARDLGNKLALKDSLGGSFGLGDLGMPFAKVPANITAQIGNYSPLGLMKSLFDLGVTVHEAKAGTLTAEQQAKAVTGIGRGLTGTAALAGFAMLSAAGVLSVSNGDDKNDTALKKSSGVTGTQLNLSALNRWISGGSTEWQDGDTLLSMNSLDPLNGLMVAGSMLADDYMDDSEIDGVDVLNASSDAIYQSIIDLPAMSTLSDLINGYKYSTGDSAIEKGFDAATEYVAGQAPGFIVPNFISGIAQGADNTVRDTYSSDSTAQQAADNIKSKIPGLRETLPANDTYGKFTNTAQKVAANVGVAEPTVKRAAQFVKGLDAAEAVSPGIKDAVLTGELKTTKAAVAAVVLFTPVSPFWAFWYFPSSPRSALFPRVCF